MAKKTLKDDLVRDQRRAANKTIRTVARNIMNGLADAGPEWSGDFKNSWASYSVSNGQMGTGTYPYKLADVPDLPVTAREMARKTRIIIENTAPHAAVAMDLEPGEFIYPGFEPQGDVVFRGVRRDSGIRGDIDKGGGGNRSTAPLDWYTTYARGGKITKAVQKGIRVVTKEANQGRFTEM